jgi:hypothetical protein
MADYLKRFFVFVFLVLLLTGCAKKYEMTLGKVFTLESDTIIKGKTSKTEIISKLGTPSMVLHDQNNNETVVYAYNAGDNLELEIGLLVIVLNEKGIVSDYYCGLQSSSAKKGKEKVTGLPLTKDLMNHIRKYLQ